MNFRKRTKIENLSPERARELALARIIRRESSKKMIRDYLVDKGAPTTMADEVIDDLCRLQVISDERFAAAFVRDQILKKRGHSLIQRSLKTKGISLSENEFGLLITELAERGTATELESILGLLKGRYRIKLDKYLKLEGLEKARKRAQFYQTLLRRGFKLKDIKTAFEQTLAL